MFYSESLKCNLQKAPSAISSLGRGVNSKKDGEEVRQSQGNLRPETAMLHRHLNPSQSNIYSVNTERLLCANMGDEAINPAGKAIAFTGLSP